MLAIVGKLEKVDPNLLGWWLCERQLEENGGLNGRPEKLADVREREGGDKKKKKKKNKEENNNDVSNLKRLILTHV